MEGIRRLLGKGGHLGHISALLIIGDYIWNVYTIYNFLLDGEWFKLGRSILILILAYTIGKKGNNLLKRVKTDGEEENWQENAFYGLLHIPGFGSMIAWKYVLEYISSFRHGEHHKLSLEQRKRWFETKKALYETTPGTLIKIYYFFEGYSGMDDLKIKNLFLVFSIIGISWNLAEQRRFLAPYLFFDSPENPNRSNKFRAINFLEILTFICQRMAALVMFLDILSGEMDLIYSLSITCSILLLPRLLASLYISRLHYKPSNSVYPSFLQKDLFQRDQKFMRKLISSTVIYPIEFMRGIETKESKKESKSENVQYFLPIYSLFESLTLFFLHFNIGNSNLNPASLFILNLAFVLTLLTWTFLIYNRFNMQMEKGYAYKLIEICEQIVLHVLSMEDTDVNIKHILKILWEFESTSKSLLNVNRHLNVHGIPTDDNNILKEYLEDYKKKSIKSRSLVNKAPVSINLKGTGYCCQNLTWDQVIYMTEISILHLYERQCGVNPRNLDFPDLFELIFCFKRQKDQVNIPWSNDPCINFNVGPHVEVYGKLRGFAGIFNEISFESVKDTKGRNVVGIKRKSQNKSVPEPEIRENSVLFQRPKKAFNSAN